ncbi:MAG TPA: transcriptional repressor LexA [Calditrichia bacterium]|nr:transcriptional repressor LexA [Calditrichota bacterium]HQU70873.1 transcriptional repressor LexA [Calditrichia bacterium]HQV33885.1 transcriptional repressor LexA [Calditrichia bacterium]
MKGLTNRQEEVLEFISRYLNDRGYPPTYQEIATELGIASKHGVVRHLEALIRKGFIEKTDTSARSIRILDHRYQPESDVVSLPLIGRVSAGYPIWAEQNAEEHIAVPRRLIRRDGKYFTLRVRGDSMMNAGIMDGDLVIVMSTNVADAGQIVVAQIEDEVTVKRLISDKGQNYLKAENPAYPDIHPQSDWAIQGKVVGLIRDVVN